MMVDDTTSYYQCR